MHALLSSPVRRALVVLVLTWVGVVGAPGPAHACKCVPGNVRQHAERADAVFTATVTASAKDTRGNGAREREVRRYRAEVDRFYQGTVSATPVVITSALRESACGLGRIPVDEPWVFFVDGQGTTFRGNSCGGSGPATSDYLLEVEGVLGAGQVLVDPVDEQPPLDYTELDVAEPTSLSRLLAPGAAAAIVGLLGLVLVRRKAAGRD